MRDDPSDDLELPRGLLVVAHEDGVALGCAGLRLRPGHIAEVTRVFVVPAARRRGLGSRLLDCLEDHARQLGADEFVVRTSDLGDAVRRVVPAGVDAALDAALVGVSALDAVRDKGSFVAVGAGAAPPPLRGTRVHNVWISADGAALAELAALADAGQLTPRVAATLPLEEVAAAHRRVAEGGLRGRIVLTPHA